MSRGRPIRPLVRGSLGRGLVLVAVGLVGCSVGPRYERPALDVPAAWASATPRPDGDEDGSGVGGIDVVAGDVDDVAAWWGAFDDPVLTALVDEALRSNLDLGIAVARLRAARARADVADSGRQPAVGASGSAGISDSTLQEGAGPTTRLDVGIDAAWEADLFGGIRSGIEAAESDVLASEATLDDVRVSLVAEVARTYVEVRRHQERLRIALRSIETQESTVELAELRARAGLASDLDVVQARAALEQTRAQIPALELAIAQNEHSLDVLLGAAPGTVHPSLAEASTLPAVPATLAVGVPADLLRRRPDVRAAEHTLVAETARTGVAEAALRPSLRLSGSVGLEVVARGTRGPFPGVFYSLLAGITAPIFEGGRLRAERDVQDAVREQAQLAWERAIVGALRDVEDALVAIAASQDRADALARALESADVAATLALLRYEAGLSDFQAVLETERTRLSVEDGIANARADCLVGVVQLYKALGGGWNPDDTMPASGESP